MVEGTFSRRSRRPNRTRGQGSRAGPRLRAPANSEENSLLTTYWSESTVSSWWLSGPASRHGSLISRLFGVLPHYTNDVDTTLYAAAQDTYREQKLLYSGNAPERDYKKNTEARPERGLFFGKTWWLHHESGPDAYQRTPEIWGAARGILNEKGIKLNLSGNEVYYTACSLLVILNNSCSKRHCKIFLFNSLVI